MTYRAIILCVMLFAWSGSVTAALRDDPITDAYMVEVELIVCHDANTSMWLYDTIVREEQVLGEMIAMSFIAIRECAVITTKVRAQLFYACDQHVDIHRCGQIALEIMPHRVYGVLTPRQ